MQVGVIHYVRKLNAIEQSFQRQGLALSALVYPCRRCQKYALLRALQEIARHQNMFAVREILYVVAKAAAIHATAIAAMSVVRMILVSTARVMRSAARLLLLILFCAELTNRRESVATLVLVWGVICPR